ncbi:triose-phosphate isomerase [Gemella sp. zg-570]|uniref:triose-phosphate isomerase n=1 Tax=Gemella sp. zg-570 TaxID=2840371 RepID=UPI001C0B1FF5|nr:triose-phosphate isomerase [Gemella sp. zg-570]QWQ38940.1 triose-phosphate isomerase [Gemella sp. zg-570]
MGLRVPYLVINPKSYLYGEELLDLAKFADQKAKEYDVDILFTAPYVELKTIAENTKYLTITAQHMDGISPGRGMGRIVGEMLYNVGVRATFLNHVEHKITDEELEQSMAKCKELGIQSVVCANGINDAKKAARLGADIIICEPDELVGTGQTSSDEYMIETNKAVKEANPNTQVLQAAGVSTAEDVYRAIYLGADSTGGTSGIIKAKDPKQTVDDMLQAMLKAYKDRENKK